MWYSVTSQNVFFVNYVLYVNSKHKIFPDGQSSALLMKCVEHETVAAVHHYAVTNSPQYSMYTNKNIKIKMAT
jgi:hypothetical protein